MKNTAQAVFLSKIKHTGSGSIITMITERGDLKKFYSRAGSKQLQSFFPLSFGEITYTETSKGSLPYLNSFDALPSNTFQFDPIRSTIAIFAAEVLARTLSENEDESVFQVVLVLISGLNEQEVVTMLPLQFLVGLSDCLGIRPLIDGNLDVFNIRDGIIGKPAPNDSSSRGGHVTLIVNLLSGSSECFAPKDVRKKSLETLLAYYSYHVPGMDRLKSYEIITQLLE